MVQIEVDKNKCPSPRDCRRCLEICPESVFMTYPRVHRMPGRKARDWVIVPALSSQCTGCMICVEACPHNAITVTFAA